MENIFEGYPRAGNISQNEKVLSRSLSGQNDFRFNAKIMSDPDVTTLHIALLRIYFIYTFSVALWPYWIRVHMRVTE